MQKIRFVILEGPDGAGKTAVLKRLTKDLAFDGRFQELDILPDDCKSIKRSSVDHYRSLFKVFESLDPTKVHVIDRFILSDIVYDSVLRKEDVSQYIVLMDEFISKFDVLYVKLDRESPRDEFYHDDKISISKEDFADIIKKYRVFQTFQPIWERKIVEESSLLKEDLDVLLRNIDFVMSNDFLPLQFHLRSKKPWIFFLGMMFLDRSTDSMARRILIQFVHQFPNTQSIVDCAEKNRKILPKLLRPLGLHTNNGQVVVDFIKEYIKRGYSGGYVFCREELEDLLDKYYADGYMAFVARNYKPHNYNSPLEKTTKLTLVRNCPDEVRDEFKAFEEI